jgi:Spy/CpxP family protein refolding chaperone
MMKKVLTKAALASTVLLASTVTLASDSADTGATEMNAGWGTFALLLGGVAAMGVVIFVMLKVMNRKK